MQIRFHSPTAFRALTPRGQDRFFIKQHPLIPATLRCYAGSTYSQISHFTAALTTKQQWVWDKHAASDEHITFGHIVHGLLRVIGFYVEGFLCGRSFQSRSTHTSSCRRECFAWCVFVWVFLRVSADFPCSRLSH